MAKDTLTATFKLEADFETIQAIRRALASAAAQEALARQFEALLAAYLAGQVEGAVELGGRLKVSQARRSRRGPRPPIPKVEQGLLSWHDAEADRLNVVGKVGGRDWRRWLADDRNRSFRYVSKHKTAFTAMRRKDGKWYAHKRLDGKLKRRYLGKTENLTVQKMDQVAFELAQRELE